MTILSYLKVNKGGYCRLCHRNFTEKFEDHSCIKKLLKIEAGAKDFAKRFKKVIKELTDEEASKPKKK